MLAVVTIDGDVTLHTYPMPLEPGVSKLPIDTTFKSLQSACWADGSDVDLTRHPLSIETEELVQVSGVTGRATLDNLNEIYRVTMIWDANDFVGCVRFGCQMVAVRAILGMVALKVLILKW